jgi:hypothetical protein
VIAWSGVLLTATYRSHTPVVLGQYSWGHVTLLGLLVCIAVMAEPLANHMVSFWSKKASPTMVAGQRERAVGRAMAEINAFAMGLAQTLAEARSYFVSLFMSCKRVTRSLMSGEFHP